MSGALSAAPRGMSFVRLAIAKSIGESPSGAAMVAANRWGETSAPARILRAAVGAATSAGLGEGFEDAATEFFDQVAQMSIVGRMAGLRQVPLLTPILSIVSGATGFWVGEGQAKPLSKMIFARDSLHPLKCIALTVVTEELLKSADPAAELAIRRDMLRAAAAAIDTSFVDPGNAGVDGVEPASITNSVVAQTAGSDATADLKSMIANFSGDLETAYFVMRPDVAVSLAGADRPNIGARGGEIYGIPAITSRSAPEDTIILADAGGIAVGEGSAAIRMSRQPAIEMLDSALQQDGTTGAGAAVVSLWQANAMGILAERTMNWSVERSGSVSVLDGVDYAPFAT
ncbi:phage major capsid protein [Ensifer sp. BR816]|uniref:phage major capsid family protein n=1 Tax=Rhizobium sp. (strain BR816) TaxID=1057002 RepID=UPI000375037E|nr:phage major capsid protein [Ensifer sp. BR816]